MNLIRAVLLLFLFVGSADCFHIRVIDADDEYVTINTYSTVPAPTYPTYVSGTIATNGTTFTIVWSEALTQGSGYNDSDLDINGSVTGSDIGLTYSSGDTTDTHIYTAASTIQSGETVTFDFNGDADSLEDSTGDDLQAIVAGAVTNSSTQSTPIYLLHETFETNPGYDNTWTTQSGTPLPDTSTSGLGLEGLECLGLNTASTETEDFTAGSDVETWVSFMLNLDDGQPVADIYWIIGYRTGIAYTARVRTDGRIRFEPTGGTAGYLNDSGGSPVYLANGITGAFYLMIREKAETGGTDNAEMEVWYSITGAWGNSGYTATDLIQPGELTKIKLTSTVNSTFRLDDIRIDDEVLPNYIEP